MAKHLVFLNETLDTKISPLGIKIEIRYTMHSVISRSVWRDTRQNTVTYFTE